MTMHDKKKFPKNRMHFIFVQLFFYFIIQLDLALDPAGVVTVYPNRYAVHWSVTHGLSFSQSLPRVPPLRIPVGFSAEYAKNDLFCKVNICCIIFFDHISCVLSVLHSLLHRSLKRAYILTYERD